MRKYVAILLVATVLRGVFAADKTVTNKELGFELTFPESFKVFDPFNEPKDGKFQIYFGSQLYAKSDDILVFVFSQPIKRGTPLKEFFVDAVNNNRIIQPNTYFQTRKNIEVAPGDGIINLKNEICYRRLIFFDKQEIFKPSGVLVQVKEMNLYFVSSDRGYLITVTADKDAFDKRDKQIDAIIQSFKLLK